MQKLSPNSLLKTPPFKWKQQIQNRTIKCELDQNLQSGKHAEVLIAKRLDNENQHFTPTKIENNLLKSMFSPNVALKTQCIQQPKDLNDRSYRELLIFHTLSSVKNECPLFVGIYDWFKSKGDFDQTEHKEFMNFILEKADETLYDFMKRKKMITLTQYKSILFQILFALHFAQKHCEFVHNDLHLKNIMIKSLPKETKLCAFHFNNQCWITREKFLVKITDFGLSRVTFNESVICNSKNFIQAAFDPYQDVRQLAKEFGKLKIDWNGDDVFLLDVTKEKKYLKSLKRKMTTGTLPEQLFQHEFFDSLKGIPSNETGVLHFGNVSQTEKENIVPLEKSPQMKKPSNHRTLRKRKPLEEINNTQTVVKPRKRRSTNTNSKRRIRRRV